MKNRTLTILFSDIEGFTERTEHETRKGLVSIAAEQHELVTSVVHKYQGEVVKTIGDGLLATFESPTASVHAGIEIQRKTALQNTKKKGSQKIRVRIGINTGEVAITDADIYGEAVNIASRVEAVAAPGEILFTESTFLAMRNNEMPIIKAGSRTLKGVSYPVKLFSVLPDQISYTDSSQNSGGERNDVESKVYKGLLPAPAPVRTASFFIDLFFSLLLAVVIPSFFNFSAYWSWITEVSRLEAESFSAPNNDQISHRYLSSYGGFRVADNFESYTSFPYRSGVYDVVLGSFNKGRNLGDPLMHVMIGEEEFLPILSPISAGAKRRLIAKNVFIEKGVTLRVDSAEGGGYVLFDFLDFIPAASNAPRPRTVEASFPKFDEFFYLINYDDYNLHFFLGRIVMYWFLINLVSFIFFPFSPGCLISNQRVVDSKGRRPGLIRSILRMSIIGGCIAMVFLKIPDNYVAILLAAFTLIITYSWPKVFHTDFTWPDIVSGTRAVVLPGQPLALQYLKRIKGVFSRKRMVVENDIGFE